MRLSSKAFETNGTFPRRYTGEGEDLSPPLSWTAPPAGTKSLALVMDDPDAPSGTWVHWVVYDIPPRTQSLPEGLPKTPALPNGGKQGACWGVDSFQKVGYYGPMPPPGSPHHYVFHLYALDSSLGLPPRATKKQVLRAIKGHVLDEASLEAVFER